PQPIQPPLVRRPVPETITAPAPAPAPVGEPVALPAPPAPAAGTVAYRAAGLGVRYGRTRALRDVTLDIHRNEITALIGPSGCGKSTFLRCLNRMNDLIPGARVDGTLLFHGEDVNASDVDPVDLRR